MGGRTPARHGRLLVGGLLLVLLFAPSARAGIREASGGLWTERVRAVGLPDDAPLDMSSFARLAKEMTPTVVHIQVQKTVQLGRGPGPGRRDFFSPFFGPLPERFRNQGLGSGFVINRDGLILTNHHVIEDADEISVRFTDGRSYRAEVVGSDPPTDTALLRIEPDRAFPVAPLGDSDALEVGEWVLAIGNPFGLSHTVTAGIVSAKGRQEIAPGGKRLVASFIQTDASINPGNSGGPLFNIRGEVVGMATAINAAAQGIGFAIPVNMLKTLVPQLARGHVERSWLGVVIRPVTEEHVEALGLPSPHGAIVERVVSDGPAAEGGVRAGDVIVGINGQDVDTTVDLQWLASTAPAGERATLDLYRRGERRQVQVVLRPMPEQAVGTPGRPPVTGRQRDRTNEGTLEGLGMRVADIDARIRRQLRLERDKGVVIIEVDGGGPAAEAGLRVGDVILVAGTTRVTGVNELRATLQKVRPGDLTSLIVLSEGETRFVDLRRGR